MAMPESTNVVTVTQLGKVLGGYNDKINTKLGTKADKVSNATSGNFAGLDANGNLTDSGKKAADFKPKQTAVSDPSASGTSISFIASASQDTNGVITVTKKSVPTAVATGTTGATDGLMTAADKQKLNGIATGAEVNQNAFSNVKVGSTTVEADSKTDTLELVAGSGVTITADATNDKITIKGTTYDGDRGISLANGKFGHSNTAITAGSVGPSSAVTGTSVSVPSITYDTYGHITAASGKTFTVQDASTNQKGIVQLSNSINSTSSSTAATSKAVTDAIADVMSKVNARAMFFESQSDWDTYIAGEGKTGDSSKVYYVKVGTGDDKYDVYVWKTGTSGGSYEKVDQSSISLDGYWHGTPTSSGSGNVVTAISLGNDGSVSYTKGITALTSHQTVTNKAATIGTSLTTIANIGGTDITAKIGSYAAASHTHGNITNDGKIGSTENLSVVTGASGAITTANLSVSSPSVPTTGTTTSLEFIDTVSQSSNGKISASKKKVLVDSTYSATGTNPVNGTAIAAALGGLDATVTSTDGKNVQVKVTEANGKITAVNITTDNTENNGNKVTAWSTTTTDDHYPSEKLVKTALDTKADKSGTVSTVTYDGTNKKITKTINGSTTDVVTAAKIVTDGGGITSHQTIKQDGITGATINRYASSSTAAATAAKTASITTGTFALDAGTRVTVKFANANTADTPTLNINSTGAKNIFSKGVQITTGSNKALLAGVVDFVYDGTQWNLVGNYIDTNSVTGVKGSAESSYRTGQVNLTPANLGISATTTSVTVGNTTFNKYVHPHFDSATAAAIKVGRDTDGHVVLGSALTRADVGIVEMTDTEVTDMLAALT
jgi:hypothetical protein